MCLYLYLYIHGITKTMCYHSGYHHNGFDNVCIPQYIHIFIHSHIHIYIYIYLYIYTYEYMLYIHVYIYIYIHVYMYILYSSCICNHGNNMSSPSYHTMDLPKLMFVVDQLWLHILGVEKARAEPSQSTQTLPIKTKIKGIKIYNFSSRFLHTMRVVKVHHIR